MQARDLDDANAVLRNAGRRIVVAGISLSAFIVFLGVRIFQRHDARGLFSLLTCGGLALVFWYITRQRYREIARLTFVESGIELRSEDRSLVIRWKDMEWAELGPKGFRIFPTGGKPFSANLALAGRIDPVLALLESRLPTGCVNRLSTDTGPRTSMTGKQHVLWWSGFAVTLAAGLTGIFVGVSAYGWITHTDLDQQVGLFAAAMLILSLVLGMLVMYVILFVIWLAVARLFASPSELLEVAGNRRFQDPSGALINRKWVAFLLRVLRLDAGRSI